jgi:hypothetical protein
LGHFSIENPPNRSNSYFSSQKLTKFRPNKKNWSKNLDVGVKTYEEGHVEIRDYLKQVPHFHSALLQRLYP